MGSNIQFEALLEGCKNAVERFIYYKIPTREDAQDIIQETFLTAYKKLDSLKDETKFKPWLLSIARNKCNDYFRRKITELEIPIDEAYDYTEYMDRSGRAVQEVVKDTLLDLTDNDRQILFMFYILGMSQKDISLKLDIPIGTVKSRLYTARQSFKESYPYPPNVKGEFTMCNKVFSDVMPEVKIVKTNKPPFSVVFEELPGWFIIPRIGEKVSWAIYDYPERTRSEIETCEVISKAKIHGIDCVEIKCQERTLYAKLTDTHVCYIADIYCHDGVKIMTSFLDDDWIESWSYGEDNCGRETFLDSNNKNVSGTYLVSIGDKSYETIRFTDMKTDGIYTETYIDKYGRTVLWRRYNRYDWAIDRFKIPWTEKLPNNQTITLDNSTYVHWYDCLINR